MGDYIERQAVLNAYDAVQRENGPWRFETLIESVPAADVRPVVRGRWEWMGPCRDNGGRLWATCPACGERQRLGDYTNFCPNCGADMRGGSEQ